MGPPLAISRQRNPTKFQKTLGLNDFYFGAPGFPYPLATSRLAARQITRRDDRGGSGFLGLVDA
jgi:hypothetical protein